MKTKHVVVEPYQRKWKTDFLEIKSELEEAAKLFPEDMDGYIEYKSPCIKELYSLCGLESD